jgi:hypothetical protein
MTRLLRLYAALTLILVLSFSVPYIAFVCQRPAASVESGITAAIEALNYSVQTITTVGYGNWLSEGPPCHGKVDVWIPLGATWASVPGVLLMKLVSVPFMLVGAGIFAVTIGLAVEWIKLAAPR